MLIIINLPGEKGWCKTAVLDALQAGYRHLDCAWMYGVRSLSFFSLRSLSEFSLCHHSGNRSLWDQDVDSVMDLQTRNRGKGQGGWYEKEITLTPSAKQLGRYRNRRSDQRVRNPSGGDLREFSPSCLPLNDALNFPAVVSLPRSF